MVIHNEVLVNQYSNLLVYVTYTFCSYHIRYYFTPESFYKPVAQVLVNDADKMSIASKIASNILKRAPSGPETTYSELWKDHVIYGVTFYISAK